MFVGKKKTALPFPVASHIRKYRGFLNVGKAKAVYYV
jgi:hypothetical protein